MNQHLSLFVYFSKITISAKFMLTKPIGLMVLMPTISLALFSLTEIALMLLGGLFICDFLTGILRDVE